MQKTVTVPEKQDAIQYTLNDSVAVVQITGNGFRITADVQKSEEILKWYSEIDHRKRIKAIVILSSSDSLSKYALQRFINKNKAILSVENDMDRSDFIRVKNILQQFILKQLQSSKLVFNCFQGNIAAPFFGVSLSADFRFVDEDTTFSLAHLHDRYAYIGGLPFFMSKYLNRGPAFKLLFSKEEIDSHEALDLGLIHNVFPKKDFKIHCIEAASKICKGNAHNIVVRKKLLNNFVYEIEHYFNLESKNIF
jgi:enoyl-CoA hydratase/carnithine racemase